MAQKICSKKEDCVHGNVLQDYSNFYRNITSADQHAGECKDCMAERRKQKVQQQRDIYNGRFDMFLGNNL